MLDKIYPWDCRENSTNLLSRQLLCQFQPNENKHDLDEAVKTLRMSLKKWQTVTLSWMAVTCCHYCYWIYQLQIVGKQRHKNLRSELLWHFQKQWEEGSVMTLAITQDFGQNLKELQLPCFTTLATKAIKFWRSLMEVQHWQKQTMKLLPRFKHILGLWENDQCKPLQCDWAQSKRTIEDEDRPKTTKICLNIILNVNQTTCPVQCAAQGQHPISASLFPFVLARLLEASLHQKDLV